MEHRSTPENRTQLRPRRLISILALACLPLAMACGASERSDLTPPRSYNDPSFRPDRKVRDGSCLLQIEVNDQGTRRIGAIEPSGCQRDSQRSVLGKARFNLRNMIGYLGD